MESKELKLKQENLLQKLKLIAKDNDKVDEYLAEFEDARSFYVCYEKRGDDNYVLNQSGAKYCYQYLLDVITIKNSDNIFYQSILDIHVLFALILPAESISEKFYLPLAKAIKEQHYYYLEYCYNELFGKAFLDVICRENKDAISIVIKSDNLHKLHHQNYSDLLENAINKGWNTSLVSSLSSEFITEDNLLKLIDRKQGYLSHMDAWYWTDKVTMEVAEKDSGSISGIPREEWNDKIAQIVFEAKDSEIKYIPKEYWTEDMVLDIWSNHKGLIKHMEKSKWTSEMADYVFEEDMANIKIIPDRLMKESYVRAFVAKDPLNLRAINKKHITFDVVAQAISSGKQFGNIYNFIPKENRTADYLESLVNKGFYCRYLMEDLFKTKSKINPIIVLRLALEKNRTQAERTIEEIKKKYSESECIEGFNEIKATLTERHANYIVTELNLDLSNEQDGKYCCSCCNKPISKDVYDQIKADIEKEIRMDVIAKLRKMGRM